MNQLIKTGLLLLASLLVNSAKCQPIYKVWDNSIQGNGRDGSFLEMIKTFTNNLLITCYSGSDSGYDKTKHLFNSPYAEPWVLMLNSTGQKIWDRDFYGAYNTMGLTQLNDNAFVLSCEISSCYNLGDVSPPVTVGCGGSGGSWIVAFDSLGVKLWDKQFNVGVDTLQNQLHGVSPLDVNAVNGKIYSLAVVTTIPNFYGGDLTVVNCPNYPPNAPFQSTHINYHHTDMLLYAINPNDSLTNNWQQLYGGDSVEIPYCIFPVGTDGFLLGGITTSQASCNQTVSAYVNPYYDYYVVRIDPTGNILWQQRYGGSKNDWLNGILDAGNGNFLLYGYTLSPQSYDVSSSGFNDTSLWIVKIDNAGNKLWDKRYGACNGFSIKGNDGINFYPPEFTSNIVDGIRTTDGGFLLVSNVTNAFPCGDVSEAGQGYEDYWLLKLESAGNKVWDKRYGGPGYDVAEKVVEMSPGYYIVGGYTRGTTAATQAAGGDKSEITIGTMDIWLVGVVDSAAVYAGVKEQEAGIVEMMLYPNPAKDNLEFRIKNSELNQLLKLTIYDITGKQLIQKQITSTATINIGTLAKGIYIVEVSDRAGNAVRRKLVRD